MRQADKHHFDFLWEAAGGMPRFPRTCKMNYFDRPGLLFWCRLVRFLALAGLQNCGAFPWEIMGIYRESTEMYVEKHFTGITLVKTSLSPVHTAHTP